MTDLRPSIPRTPAQATLRLVSVIMGIVGGVVVLAGVRGMDGRRSVIGVPLVGLRRDYSPKASRSKSDFLARKPASARAAWTSSRTSSESAVTWWKW